MLRKIGVDGRELLDEMGVSVVGFVSDKINHRVVGQMLAELVKVVVGRQRFGQGRPDFLSTGKGKMDVVGTGEGRVVLHILRHGAFTAHHMEQIPISQIVA